ncbi:MAG TPA: translocation/assembly module TamB domain-containing protein [Polyangia bacterium]|nr:translocation/assembly module TamB domain-containing protein [Polyangia bacterium]
MATRPRAHRSAWERAARGAAWLIFGPLVAGLALVSLALLYARTDAGRDHVRRAALAQARKVIPGLDVGRVEGDYVHDLRLVDVDVRDRQGRAAVHADSVLVRFALAPLLQHRVAVSELRIDGARVLGLADSEGRLNLADLVAPTPAEAPRALSPAASGPSAWRMHVERIVIDGAATLEPPDGGRVELTSLSLLGALRMDDAVHVAVERLDVRSNAGALALRGSAATARDARGATTLGDYVVSLQAADLDPARAGAGPTARLSLTLAARGRGLPLAPGGHGSATLRVSPSEVAGIAVKGAELDATTTGERWAVTKLGARLVGLSVAGGGHGEGPRVDAAALKATLDGALPGAATGNAQVSGNGVLAIVASGAWPSLETRLSGDLRSLRVAGARAGAISIAGRLAGPLTSPRTHLHVAARAVAVSPTAPRIDRATLDASDDRGALRVSAAVAGPRVRGGLRAHGHVTSALADVTLDALSLDVETRLYRQSLALQQPTRIRLEPGRLVQWAPTALRGRGYRFTGEAVTDGMYRLAPVRQAPLATGHLALRQASFAGFPPVDAAVAVEVTSRRATVKVNADLPRAEAQLDVDASLPIVVLRRGPPRLAKRGDVTLHLGAHCVRLQELPVVAEALARQGVTGGGARLELDVTGDVAHPDAHGRFDVRDLMYRNIHGLGRDSKLKTVPGLGGSLTLETAPGLTRLEGSLLIRGAGVLNADARARFDLAEFLAGADPSRAPLHASVDIPAIQLASLANFLDELQGVSGQLTAHADLDGTLARPSGGAHLTVANAKADAVAFENVDLRASADGARVDATLNLAEAAGGTLTASARLERARGDRVSASASARDLDLGFVRLLVPTLRETAGRAQLTAKASGTLRWPSVQASLTVENGRLGVIGQPTFHDVRVAATLTPTRATLSRLEMRSGGGTLSGAGWVALDGLTPRQAVFTAHAHRFLVAAAGATGARLDGDLAVEAALRRDVVDGQVRVPRAEVWLPKTPTGGGRNLQKIGQHDDVRFVDEAARVADERRRTTARAAAARPPPRAVDVHVRTGTIYVRGKDLDLEVESTLKVGSVPAGLRAGQLTLAGGIHIRRGRINIQGQRFDFDRGDITFNGGPDLNPALDIRIQRQYPDALVVVELRGTPQKPVLRLTSDPPVFDEAQIVSLILTGQAGGQPSTGKAFDPTAAVATAVLSRLADELAPEVGLDVLRVENTNKVNSEGAATGDTDTRVEVGKYISDRVYLSYAHVFGANEYSNQNEAHVEYRLTRRWMVESIFGDAGVGGVDALWTYRY